MTENEGSCLTTPLQINSEQRKPGKRQTRQWAAWTHEEEENFFSALRQVGKNFEKITSRVQSKNKDQVRHYYYRLVRRMNKLLGPELGLDAKNSKDTNAAMLRWWSLLEKYSCKASKLHLKPRRFKLIVETLENQLLKDRKKNVRKRPSVGENCTEMGPASFPNQVRASLLETGAVKPVLIDNQNIQKFGSGRGSSVKRQSSVGLNRGVYKPESSSMKTSRNRNKTVSASTAAYKKWEKAAIAGVSLVADAAEHLERTSIDKEVEHVQENTEQQGFNCASEKVVPSLQSIQCHLKLKVQLFPIDESTRRALELDKHNPHLQLTLSTRKRISSVLEHLTRKWGGSRVACGDLILVPYDAQTVNLVGCHKWTKDSILSAADVYAQVGRPTIFRLRYGWFSYAEAGFAAPSVAPLSCPNKQNGSTRSVDDCNADCTHTYSPTTWDASEKLSDLHRDCVFPAAKMALVQASDISSGMTSCPGMPDVISESSNHLSDVLLREKENDDVTVRTRSEHQNNLKTCQGATLSAREWADTLTNISVGDLLAEESRDLANCLNAPEPGKSDLFEQLPFSCDSFDAAIAAHFYKHQSQTCRQTPLSNHVSSLWDAEVTCDEFSFPRKGVFSERGQIASRNCDVESFQENAVTNTTVPDRVIEEPSNGKKPVNDREDFLNDIQLEKQSLDSPMRDLNALTDMYWPDSLGPLDLDVISCKYRTDDLILSDSLSGLSRLIASSLDAFQSCSFFGPEKKESATVEAGETTSISDVKVDAKA